MKIKTQKKSKTVLKFYVTNYGFRKPFQVLLDGTLCQAALQNKVIIMEQFPKYLEGDVKILSTQCVVLELEKLRGIMKGALAIVKQFGYHKCGHEKSPVSAYECLRSMIGEKNESRYIIATQDHQLRVAARNVPGTPVIYLNGHTPVLENPSPVSVGVAHAAGQAKFMPAPLPLAVKPKPEKERKTHKKKGGPNPMSCLKKKKKPVAPSQTKAASKTETEPKKKRKRIKLAKHLKEVKREMLGQAP